MLVRFHLTLVMLVLSIRPLYAQVRPEHTLDSLSCLSWCKLEHLYSHASPGSTPEGYYRGHVVYRPCETLAGVRGDVANFLWQGKHFCGPEVINQWRGPRLIKAQASLGESWLDGQPAHILDYQHTSVLWRTVRDEAREVSPGVYVGAMYLRRSGGPHLKLLFLLEKTPCR